MYYRGNYSVFKANHEKRKPAMTDGIIRIQLVKVRSFSLQFTRNLYSELRKALSLDSMDSIRSINTGKEQMQKACS